MNRLLLAAVSRSEQVTSRDDPPEVRSTLTQGVIALSGASREFLPDIQTARADARTTRVIDARTIDLAELIIEGLPLPPTGRNVRSSPVSSWINVERVFEQAVRALAREVFSPAHVHAGLGDGTELLSSRIGEPAHTEKMADPDVVIDVETRPLLLDAKYRRHGESLDDPELYQLMAHASAYDAAAAALVCPAIRSVPAIRPLGRDRNGTSYDIISVDPTSAESMRSMLRLWRAHINLLCGRLSNER